MVDLVALGKQIVAETGHYNGGVESVFEVVGLYILARQPSSDGPYPIEWLAHQQDDSISRYVGDH